MTKALLMAASFAVLVPLFGWMAGALPHERFVLVTRIVFWVALYGFLLLRVHRLMVQLRGSMLVAGSKRVVIHKFMLTAWAAIGAVLTYHWSSSVCGAMPGAPGQVCTDTVLPLAWIACAFVGVLAFVKATQLAPYAGRILFRRIAW